MFSVRVEPTELIEGDHILVRRYGLAYSHHGVYLGNDRVIHYCECDGLNKKMSSRVVETSLDEFLRGGQLRRRDHSGPSPRPKVVRRARKHLSRSQYSLLWNNCEHFASYCATGRRKSPQVTRFLAASVSAIGFFAGAVVLNAARKRA